MEFIHNITNFITSNHGLLFLILLLTNFFDWLTGWAKARINRNENSSTGLLGILRKIGLWVLVFMAFLLSYAFIELGSILGINMNITQFFGWFILLSLIINEIRSILENLVECKINVPIIFVKGLAIFEDKIEDLFISEKEDEKK